MDTTKVFVLVKLNLNAKGDVERKNVGVTFNIHDAEAHKDAGFENEVDELTCDASILEGAAVTATVEIMRDFRAIIADQCKEALA